MNENVALTKKKQKSFNKSVEKTKDKIEKGNIKIEENFVRKHRKPHTGVVYISHIPHGFYEKELRGYFGQFGDVLKVRVARSKRTGNSKGHAFIKFKEEEVAKIAAETMNNYLMGKRLLKAKILPYDEKTKALFKNANFSKEHYPTKVRRLRFKKSFNAPISEENYKKKTKNALKHIKNVKNKLKEIGIDYDFKPVNVPKDLDISKCEITSDDSSDESITFISPKEMAQKQTKVKDSKIKTALKVKKNKTKSEDNVKNKIITSKENKHVKKIRNSTENIDNEKEMNISRNKRKIRTIKGDPQIKKMSKKRNEKNSSNQISGIIKKTKKVQKLSDKKTALIKQQIQSNTQVEMVEKKKLGKKRSKINV